MMRTTVTAGLSVSVIASGLAIAALPAQGSPVAALTPTNFAMEASGYATRVKGGQVPASSDQSAFQVIGCTNLAGKNKRNAEANVDMSPLLDAEAATTRVWTTSKAGVVSSWARNSIAKVRLGASPATINGITSRSRAFHDATGFHANAKMSVASVDLDGAGSLPPIAGPTAGTPVRVPGVAVISVGAKTISGDTSGAAVQADALRVKFLVSDTVVFLAHSRATITGGVVSGLFRGSAYASKANAADGSVTSGKTPFIVMPCQGTDGQVIRRDIARVNPKVIINGVVAKGLHADQSAEQTQTRASAYERGRVERLRLGDADTGVVVKGIVGKANVRFVRGEGITKDTKGSSVLGVFVNGNRQTFGADDVITIPGLVRLEQHIVKRTKLTIQVTELRATLLGGARDGAQIDLGVAKVGFSRAGL